MEKFNELINGDQPVLVDFFATWCGPCKIMHPVLDDLKKEMGDQVRIIKVDIDSADNRNLVERYNVQSVPTMFLFKNGQIVWKQIGAMGLAPIREVVQNNL